MKTGFKSGMSVFMALVTAVSLAACGSSNNKETTKTATSSAGSTVAATEAPKEVKTLKITMHASWYGKGWQAVENDINANADKLGFKLDFDKLGEGDQADLALQARAASGDIPDLLAYQGAASIRDKLHISDKLVDLTGADFTKNYDPSTLNAQAYSLGGKLLGVPLGGTNIPGIFYNKKVFSDLGLTPPTNWTEFLAICEKVKAAGKIPFFMPGKDTWIPQILAIIGLQREFKDKDPGQEWLNLDTNKTSILSYSKLQDTYVKMLELKDKGYIQKTWLSDTYAMQQKAIVEGTAAMTCSATWMMDEIAKSYPDKVNDVSAFAAVFDGNDPIPAFLPNGVHGFTTSKNLDAVKAFLNYFGSLEAQTIYFKAQPGIPVIKGIKLEGLNDASTELYNEWSTTGRGQVCWQGCQLAEDVILDTGDFPGYAMNVLVGSSTPEKVLKDIRAAMEKDAKTKGVAGW